MPDYDALYPWGTRVRVRDLHELQEFKRTWKYHHPLHDEQLPFAGQEARVSEVSYYHGGDVLYRLGNVPGYWHERCLAPIEEQKSSGS